MFIYIIIQQTAISSEISQDSFFEKQMVQCWPGLQVYDKYKVNIP